jgi:hypothetical protein
MDWGEGGFLLLPSWVKGPPQVLLGQRLVKPPAAGTQTAAALGTWCSERANSLAEAATPPPITAVALVLCIIYILVGQTF